MKARSMSVRLLSLLLCLTLVVGILPTAVLRDAFRVSAAETEEPTVVIAASDYQASTGDSTGTEVIRTILNKMGYTSVDGVLFAGDYAYTTTTATNISNLETAFTGALQIANDLVLVQGNHDADSWVSDGTLSASGAHDAADYGVFVIHEQDYMYKNDDEARIQQTASNLDAYLDAKIADGYSKPIFVVSHLPLHYTVRTQVESHDGMHAKYIFDVLNEAGEKGLNIIFLFGHNHSHGWDDPYGGASIFLEPGSSINIAQHSTTDYTVETLHFTYMNAGYVGYYRHVNEEAETTLTMTAFEITDNEVKVMRYSQDGLHELKSVGVPNKHAADGSSVDGSCSINHGGKETYDPDISTVNSPFTLSLNKSLEKVEQKDEESGITVAAPGITGVKVLPNVFNNVDEKYSAYFSYDIQVEGYTDGSSATVSIPAPDTFDATRQVLVLHDGVVIATVPVLDGKITFTTNHFSVYDIAQLAQSEGDVGVLSWIEIPGESKTIFRLTDSFTSGKKYVIVSTNQAGNANAVNLNRNDISTAAVTVIADEGGNYIEAPATTAQWTFNSSEKLRNVSNTSRYLRGRNTKNSLRTTEDSGDSYTAWLYDTKYGVQCQDGRYIPSSITGDMVSPSPTDRVYIYVEETLTIPGVYAGMTGQTSYHWETGKYARQVNAEQEIRNNIRVYTAEDSVGTNATETTDYQLTGAVNPTEAGKYTLTVTYGGKTLGTVQITVADKLPTSLVVEPMVGTVERGSRSSTETGSTLTMTYDDGSTDTIPVTLAMLSGEYNINRNGTYTGLTISYGGLTVEGYTLKVVDVSGNNYPTYPNGGSVNVDKMATGQDFQNTGVARVDLSVSGLPSRKGVDVVIVIDTSSSMRTNLIGTKPRIQVLSESLEKMLTSFKQLDSSGSVPDIDIAIIDFNGYDTAISGAKLDGEALRDSDDKAKVYTGANQGKSIMNITLSANDFVSNSSLTPSTVAGMFTNETCKSGTNYDGALLNAYKLLSAKKAANTEDRDQYVVFLSDGAPFRYNGYDHGVKNYPLWAKWLEGEWKDVDALRNANLDYTGFPGTHPEFYNGQVNVTGGTAQPHRTAEAIKGEVGRKYDVVVNTAASTGYIEQYEGLGARIFSIGFGLTNDQDLTKETQAKLVEVLSSGTDYCYRDVQTADELDEAFNQIVSSIRFAAQNAAFTDQMGSAFDLQMNPSITDSSGATHNDISTDITVTSNPIYMSAQVGTSVNGYTVTADDVGKAYGDGTLLERVSFAVDASGNLTAASNKKTGNILQDGVICASTFWYNTTNAMKKINVNGTERDLEPETFYWNIGIINEQQFTLSYAVYLTGSMEGDVSEGSYDTNNFATLRYINWLGNDASQSVASPAMPWKAANVSYAFYLVNDEGKPVDANGNVVNIFNAYKVTQPVRYQTTNLNSGETVSSETVAKNVLPAGYTLYANEATYTVEIRSGQGGGSWTIAGDSAQTTYVTGYAGAQDYSNRTSASESTYDYTHTTVYFAVVWTVGAVQDTIVIDFGLPVDVSVLLNDMFGNNGELVAVGPYTEGMENNHTQSLNAGFGGSYGDAVVNGRKVRYTPSSMEMNKPVVLAYAVHYTGLTNPGYYYGKLTVIPATTVYYEDSFLTLKSFTDNTEDDPSKWTQEGSTEGKTQNEDRPGVYSRPEYDANNIYGYDSAYTNMSTYSMGSAAKVHVDAGSYATASFSFYGTGFDVISMTSNTTGMLAVEVKDSNEATVKTTAVNTYYGYTRKTAEDGTVVWVPTQDTDNALYQVPVIKVEGLPYAKYTVTITATYMSAMDKTAPDGYDLYLDAIRIYDPTGNEDETANGAYVADGEGWPVYLELRNNIIDANTFDISDSSAVNGIVFIDGNAENVSIADYTNYGPNNELYLAQGQAVAFNLNPGDKVADIQLGVKVASGNSVTCTLNGAERTISTTSDLYYSIKKYMPSTLVIQNTSGGILSLTNIKITHTEKPDVSTEVQSILWMDGPSAVFALRSLRAEPEVAVFAPEKLTVSLKKTQVTVGDRVTVTVKTSEDVAYLTVNGETVTNYSSNRRTGERTWTVKLTAEDVGELIVDVVAYNTEDVASETVTNTVTVVEKKDPAEVIRDILDDLFGWIFG